VKFVPYAQELEPGPESGNEPDPVMFADLDGNGTPDYVTALYDRPTGGDGYSIDGPWTYRLNTGQAGPSRFGGSQPTNMQVPANGEGGLMVDSDGDGRVDLIGPGPDGSSVGWGLDSAGVVGPRTWADGVAVEANGRRGGVAGDINGDGLSDIVMATSVEKADSPLPDGRLRGALSSGNGGGFAPFSESAADYKEPRVCCPATPVPNPGPEPRPRPAVDVAYDRGVRYADFNGDGNTDVLVFRGNASTGLDDINNGLQVLTWQVDRFVRERVRQTAGDWGPQGVNTRLLDFNGDGMLDILHVEGDHLQVLVRREGPPDRLTAVGDADKRGRVEFTYASLNNTAVHTRCTSAYPVMCLDRGGLVVSSHRVTTKFDGTSDSVQVGWETFNHTYTSARADLWGRGWLGFATHTVTRAATGQSTVTEFDNATRDTTAGAPVLYPFAMLPKKVTTTVTTGSGPTAREHKTTVTNVATLHRNFARHTVTLDKSTELVQERPVDGAWTTVRNRVTDTLYDGYGNADLVTVTTTGGRKTITDPTFRNDAARWLIGLPTRMLTTGCTAVNVCLTRETTADYDAVTGNPTVSTVEPTKPEFKLTTTTTFGTFGQIETVTRTPNTGRARTETFLYENADKLAPTAVLNAAGHKTVLETHSGLGVVLKSTDPNGFVTATTYDRFGRPREVKRSDRSFTKTTYASVGGWQRVTTDLSGGSSSSILTDQLGREQERTVKGFDGRNASTFTDYDSLGRVAKVSMPMFPGGTAIYTTTRYDELSRVTTVTAPDSVQVKTTYVNRETHVFDGRNVERYTVATPDGDVASSYEDDPDDPTAGVFLRTRFEYGPFGETTKIVALDGTRDSTQQVMEYDLWGRRTKLTDPSSGVTSSTYNHFGELVTETDAENRTTTLDLDDLGRVKTSVSPDGTLTNTWDTATNGIGKLAKATSPDGTVTDYTYTGLSQQDKVTWTVGGTAYEFDYDYDTIGRPSGLKYPKVPGTAQRLSIVNVYNSNGYLSQVTDAAAAGPSPSPSPTAPVYWTAQARNAAGQLTQEQYGNGVVTKHNYKAETGLLENTKADGPGTVGVLSDLTYVYDNNRNITDRNDKVNQRNQKYHYDNLNRLDNWQWAPTQATGSVAYTYDDIGNLKKEVVARTGDTTTYTYGQNGHPHALATRNGVSYQYNKAGEQVSGAGRSITYNTNGLPTTMTWGQGQTTTYRYDAAGARVRKADGSGTTITIGGLFELRDPAGTGSTDIHNLYNIVVEGRTIAQVTKTQNTATGPVVGTDKVLYLNADAQGSTVLLTNSAGREIDNEEGWLKDLYYDPWGRRVDAAYQPLGQQRRGGPRQGFTSHYHDDENGLVNMKGRIYDPETRRFLTPDPIIANPLSSQQQNRYPYVQNNPATLTDPTGNTATSNSRGSNRLGNPLGSLFWAQQLHYSYNPEYLKRNLTTSSLNTLKEFVNNSKQNTGRSDAATTDTGILYGSNGADEVQGSTAKKKDVPKATSVGRVISKAAAVAGVIHEGEAATEERRPNRVDVFGFGSLSAGNPGPVRVEAEVIGLVGWDSDDGGYTGAIAAAGVAAGGEANYIETLAGLETINGEPPQGIHLAGGSLGIELPFLGGIGLSAGRYATQDGDVGIYIGAQGGVLGQHTSVGIGGTVEINNLDFIFEISPSLKRFVAEHAGSAGERR
jgi:RHS repeat-associated protein